MGSAVQMEDGMVNIDENNPSDDEDGLGKLLCRQEGQLG